MWLVLIVRLATLIVVIGLDFLVRMTIRLNILDRLVVRVNRLELHGVGSEHKPLLFAQGTVNNLFNTKLSCRRAPAAVALEAAAAAGITEDEKADTSDQRANPEQRCEYNVKTEGDNIVGDVIRAVGRCNADGSQFAVLTNRMSHRISARRGAFHQIEIGQIVRGRTADGKAREGRDHIAVSTVGTNAAFQTWRAPSLDTVGQVGKCNGQHKREE